ncbi:hypothetical protein EOPP23_18275 [Endozoicomonas sp. OPT23]|uniref:hypothetical protein n=1 Tax=Endozoicomonas sp. OPT23 TaxID=2072845 RepID=UPI00129B5953|nr:hypothetical protein [Endozoicomonas sp. OPT23]MRI34925.1 hypothetical protein [Endozoicomonas sp. OPT23]
MLPMGTIMTGCMIAGLILAIRPAFLKSLPKAINKGVASLVFLAGVWNVFWYWLQHPTEFWGLAALVSGSMMLITAAYIVNCKRMPGWLIKLKPVVLFALLACALLYGITIYRL